MVLAVVGRILPLVFSGKQEVAAPACSFRSGCLECFPFCHMCFDRYFHS